VRVLADGRVWRTESEWKELLTRWGRSQSSAQEFCRKEKIHVTSLQRWEKRLSGALGRNEFVSVVPLPPPPPSSSPSWTVKVTLPNGVHLHFEG